LHQEVCVVLDAHGTAAYGWGALQSVKRSTKYRPPTRRRAFQAPS
jgi:hypothetical protein